VCVAQPRRSRSPGRIIFSARAGLFPDRSRPLAHIASGAPSGQPASHRSSNLVTPAGRIRTSMRREKIQQLQAAPRCNAGFDPGMISRRSNQPEGLKWQRLGPYERFADMIDRHWDGIAAYCKPENKVSLGFVEGLNNKIRVFQRRAYGLRDNEYLRLKV